MGDLKKFDLTTFECDTYVETGTGHGGTLSTAVRMPCFKSWYSVDIDPQRVIAARPAFGMATLEISTSVEALEKWLNPMSEFISLDSKVFFFLDAHFPNADYNGEKYDVSTPHAVPLKEELEIIKKYRPNCKDVIVCDDARIYLSGPFEAGDVSSWLSVPGGYQFIEDIFPGEKIGISYSDQGYIIIDRR